MGRGRAADGQQGHPRARVEPPGRRGRVGGRHGRRGVSTRFLGPDRSGPLRPAGPGRSRGGRQRSDRRRPRARALARPTLPRSRRHGGAGRVGSSRGDSTAVGGDPRVPPHRCVARRRRGHARAPGGGGAAAGASLVTPGRSAGGRRSGGRSVAHLRAGPSPAGRRGGCRARTRPRRGVPIGPGRPGGRRRPPRGRRGMGPPTATAAVRGARCAGRRVGGSVPSGRVARRGGPGRGAGRREDPPDGGGRTAGHRRRRRPLRRL